jgi:plasmid stability protein
MSAVMIQIRNVPPELHRRLKARAATEGMSMSDYVLREIRKSLEHPTRAEVLERLAAQPVRRFRQPLSEVIHSERESR